MKKNIYLDHASTTPTDPRVVKAMEPYWTKYYGNPSSLYQLGLQSKNAITLARVKISQLLDCQADELIFTGGGTESINLALKGVLQKNPGAHFITSSIEHHAVLHTADTLKKLGHSVSILPVDDQGFIRLEDIEKAIKDNTKLISIMIANNEIGVIQDIQKIGALIEKINRERIAKGLPIIYFHTDACQAGGTLDLNVKKLHVDLLTINGSKVYGPKGVGALYIKTGTNLGPIIDGGGQEKNIRSGTENVPGIVGLATALELAHQSQTKENARLIKLRDKLIKEILEEAKFKIFEVDGYEADDMIGTIANQAKDLDVIILSGDRDLLQLVNGHVMMIAPITGVTKMILFNKDKVVEKYGLDPEQIPDYKALVGDPSDNYPGVAGIGPKTASDLIKKFDSLENLYQRLSEVAPKIAEKLAIDAEQSALAKKLATIDVDAPIKFVLDQAKTDDIDEKSLLKNFKKLGFNSLINRFNLDKAPEITEISEEPGRKEEKKDADQMNLI